MRVLFYKQTKKTKNMHASTRARIHTVQMSCNRNRVKSTAIVVKIGYFDKNWNFCRKTKLAIPIWNTFILECCHVNRLRFIEIITIRNNVLRDRWPIPVSRHFYRFIQMVLIIVFYFIARQLFIVSSFITSSFCLFRVFLCSQCTTDAIISSGLVR